MKPTRLLALATLAVLAPSPASAQVEPGDVFFIHSQTGNPRVTAVGVSGTPHFQIQGQQGSWISGTRLSDGRYVLHDNTATNSRGCWVFTTAGTYQFNWTITAADYTGDLDAFSDDVLVLATRGEGLRLYDIVGNFQGLLSAPGMLKPFGLEVQTDDTVWVADQQDWPSSSGGRIFHLDRSSNVLHAFDVPFSPSDVATGPDGTVWVADFNAGFVYHYHPDGTLIHSFSAQIVHQLKTLWTLAVGDDGVVWTSGHYDDRVHGFDAAGNVVYQYDLAIPGNTVFAFGGEGVAWATPVCLGDGSAGVCPCGNFAAGPEGCLNSTGRGALLDVVGSNRVGADDLGLLASQLPAGRPALAVVGDQTVAGVLYGDGLRCAGGSVRHLGVRFADAWGSASWGPNLTGQGGWNAGDTRTFQVWFRDPLGGPCGGVANTTTSQQVLFLP